MNFKAKLAVALIALAPWLTVSARAMSFDDFAAMNNDDEAGFVALLIETASQNLKAHGQPDQAARVITFFKDPSDNGGVHQLATNMKMLNALNTRNATSARNQAPAYQVEDAMELTLRNAGVIVAAKDLLASSQNFVPAGPSRHHVLYP